jgi:hypothetical protein
MQTLSRKEQIILVSFTWAVNALVLSDHTASSYGFLSRIPVQTSMHVSNSRRRNVTRAMYTGSNWSILDFSPVEEIFKASYICKKSKLKTLFYWKVFYDTSQNIVPAVRQLAQTSELSSFFCGTDVNLFHHTETYGILCGNFKTQIKSKQIVFQISKVYSKLLTNIFYR